MKNNKIDLKFIILMVVLISGFVYIGSGSDDEFEFHPTRPMVINKKTGEIHLFSNDSMRKDLPGRIVKH